MINIKAYILCMNISDYIIFVVVSKYLSLWNWPSFELAIIGVNCVSKTHFFSKQFSVMLLNITLKKQRSRLNWLNLSYRQMSKAEGEIFLELDLLVFSSRNYLCSSFVCLSLILSGRLSVNFLKSFIFLSSTTSLSLGERDSSLFK